MEVGEIIVYRNVYPSKASPVEFSSGGGSSDNKGFNTVSVNRPAVLTGMTSAWLGLLGSGFSIRQEMDQQYRKLQRPPRSGSDLSNEAGQRRQP